MTIASVLPFHLDEPIYIVKFVDSLLSGEGAVVETKLNELKDAMTLDPETEEHIVNITPQLLNQYENECYKAQALSSVIKLREYIKWAYNLNYDPIQRFEEGATCKTTCQRRIGLTTQFSWEDLPSHLAEIDYDDEFEEIPEFLLQKHNYLTTVLNDAVTDIDARRSIEDEMLQNFSDDDDAASKKPKKTPQSKRIKLRVPRKEMSGMFVEDSDSSSDS